MYTWYNRIEKRLVFDYSRLKLSETVWKMRASNQKVREIYRRFVPLHAMISLNGKCYVVDSTVLVLYCANIHLLLGVFFRERLVDSNSKENLAIEVEMTLPCPLHYFQYECHSYLTFEKTWKRTWRFRNICAWQPWFCRIFFSRFDQSQK